MPNSRLFYHLLANTLLASVMNFTVWFAITFYTFLQTNSVFATGMISGIYLVATASSGIWFGSLVDRYKKKRVMIGSSIASLFFYAISLGIYLQQGDDAFRAMSNPMLWIFIVILMAGVIVGNIRTIALPTIVTILFPADKRDKANGLVGTASGISFLVTSVISGLLVGHSGMYWVLILAITVTFGAIIHLLFISIPEKSVAHMQPEGTDTNAKEAVAGHTEASHKVDIRGTVKVIKAVPGLLPLILFATFNNFLGGVYMALMDAYGLSLVSVQKWGIMWGFLSTAFILGGILVAKKGLGKNPLKTLFTANIIIWTIATFFTVYPSIIILVAGMFVYLCVIPFIEASEQTIIQKVVPHERQGRVFGFAQSVEQAASPLTAFLIGPLTQFIFIPFMTDGWGARNFGSVWGSGSDRGIALVFTLTGIIGLAVTTLAFNSRFYKQLSRRYLKG